MSYACAGARAERTTLAPAGWKTASNAAVKLASRSCKANFTLIPASSRSISRFLACYYPRLNRVLRGAQNPDPAGAMLDHGQDVDRRAVEEIGGEEIQRQDPLRLGPQELGPVRSVPARRRLDASALEYPPHSMAPR
jgi:hypothetical protein